MPNNKVIQATTASQVTITLEMRQAHHPAIGINGHIS